MKAAPVVHAFRDYLEETWDALEKLRSLSTSSEDQLADWCQANWEIFVEAALLPEGNHYLEVYGDGAECNGGSSRVWKPSALPTHRIHCSARIGSTVVDLLTGEATDPRSLNFWGFVAWDGMQYESSYPFRHVLLEGGRKDSVVELDLVEFDLAPISP